MTLGEHLQGLRQRSGLSQEEVAQQLFYQEDEIP